MLLLSIFSFEISVDMLDYMDEVLELQQLGKLNIDNIGDFLKKKVKKKFSFSCFIHFMLKDCWVVVPRHPI